MCSNKYRQDVYLRDFLGSAVIIILVMIDIAKHFGQGAGFGIGLFFLGFIFFPILAFGDAQYVGKRIEAT